MQQEGVSQELWVWERLHPATFGAGGGGGSAQQQFHEGHAQIGQGRDSWKGKDRETVSLRACFTSLEHRADGKGLTLATVKILWLPAQ